MTAKVWAMALVVLIATTCSIFSFVQGLLRVPIEGSIPLFLTGMVLHLFATTSLGIFLGTLARSMPKFISLVLIGSILFAVSLTQFRKTIATTA